MTGNIKNNFTSNGDDKEYIYVDFMHFAGIPKRASKVHLHARRSIWMHFDRKH